MRYLYMLLIAAMSIIMLFSETYAYEITLDINKGVFTDNITGYEFLQMDRYVYSGGMKLSEYVAGNGLHLATADELAVLFKDIGVYGNIIPAYDIGLKPPATTRRELLRRRGYGKNGA